MRSTRNTTAPNQAALKLWLRATLLACAALGGVDAPEVEAQDYRAAARATRTDFDSARSESSVSRAVAERAIAENVGAMLPEAGLVVSHTGSISAVPILRGLTGSSVLLMSDELRLNDSLTRPGGNSLLNLLDPESVEEVEIIRGPASVLYGSDALGGVVRVESKTLATGPGAASDASATIYGRGSLADKAGRGSAAVEGVHGVVGARVSGGVGRAGLITRGGDLGEQPFTGHHDATLSSRLQLTPTRQHDLSLSYQLGHQWDVPRSDVSTPEDQQRTVTLDRDAALLRYGGDFSERGVRVQGFAGMISRRELRERARDGGLEQEYDRVLSYQLGASVTFLAAPGASLDLGADAVLERIGSSAVDTAADGTVERGRGRYLDDSRYDMAAVYALWSQALDAQWKLLVGARATLVHAEAPIDPLFDAELQKPLDRTLLGPVGSVGVRFDVTPELSWLLSGLSGFRAPNLEDFQAFGGGARGFTVPSSELSEEHSWTLETGLKLARPKLQASLFVFGSVLTGLIVRVPSSWDGMTEIDGEPVLKRDNASRAVLIGAEAELRARLPYDLYASAAASAVWGETRRPDESGTEITEPASKVPGPLAALRFGWERERGPYFAELAAVFQMPQTRLSEGDRMDVRLCEDGPEGCDRVAGYVNLALRAGVRVDDILALTVAVDNLLDVAYKTYASGAYATGRNLIVGLRGSL